jgi:hypothetical protein
MQTLVRENAWTVSQHLGRTLSLAAPTVYGNHIRLLNLQQITTFIRVMQMANRAKAHNLI